MMIPFFRHPAVWVITAALHVVREVPRLMQQQAQQRWQRFTVDTLQGKTLLMVGHGGIVVFDDFSPQAPGLIEAVAQLIASHRLERVFCYQNTLVLRK